MTKADKSKALYDARRAARKCVDCAAGIEEGEDAARCVECRERCMINSRRSRRKLSSERMTERHEKQKARYWSDPETKRGAMRAARYERYQSGVCKHCMRERMPQYATCAVHREICRLESYAKWLHQTGKPNAHVKAQLKEARKGACIYPLPARPAKPERVVVRDEDDRGQMRPRVLRALRFFDWIPARELFDAIDAIGVSMDWESLEYNNAAVQLSRLCRDGLAERRAGCGEGFGQADYRITDAGRAAADKYRRAA